MAEDYAKALDGLGHLVREVVDHIKTIADGFALRNGLLKESNRMAAEQLVFSRYHHEMQKGVADSIIKESERLDAENKAFRARLRELGVEEP